MKVRLFLPLIAAILYTLFGLANDSSFNAPENQNTENASKKVVFMIADYLSFEDLEKQESMKWLLDNSYLALLNNRQNGRPSPYKAKAILGAGRRVEMPSDMLGGGTGRKWHDLYRINNGQLQPSHRPVFPQISKLISLNSSEGYDKRIGYLGDAIHSQGGKTCFIGNADSSLPNRSTILIPMDRSGAVDMGDTETLSAADNRYPYSIRTDYSKLEELYKQFLPASSFLVIETGDLERLEKNRSNMSPAQYQAGKQLILDDISRFLKGLADSAAAEAGSPEPVVILLSSYPASDRYDKGDRLTPVIVYDGVNRGILFSSGTRREGIVLNTELADYILYKLGMLKRSPIEEKGSTESLSFITELNGKTLAVSRLRLPVLTSFAVFVILSLLLCFLALINPFLLRSRFGSVIRVLVRMNLLGPLLLLVLPAYLFKKPLLFAALFFLSIAFLSIIMFRLKTALKVEICAICLATVLTLALDISAGSPLIKYSVIGYDPIIGARFYGVGNELAGVFVGCSILLTGAMKEIYHKKIKAGYVIIGHTAFICLLGLSFWGANLGGALAAFTGYYSFLLLSCSRKGRIRQFVLLPLILAGLIALLVYIDSYMGSKVSHVGLFFQDIQQNGIDVLLSTLYRKTAMNFRLIRYTIWTKVLLCIIFILITTYFKPVGVVRRVFRAQPYLKAGWISATAASICGFLLNDSGIVLAATAMIYVVFTLLLVCFDSMAIPEEINQRGI